MDSNSDIQSVTCPTYVSCHPVSKSDLKALKIIFNNLIVILFSYGYVEDNAEEFSMLKAFELTLLSCWKYKGHLRPTKISARILYIRYEASMNLFSKSFNLIFYSIYSILFFGLCLYRYWEATLDASLLVEKTNLPFDGIETLMMNSNYRIAVYPGTLHEDFFRHSNDPVMKKAWTERIEPYMDFYKEHFASNFNDESCFYS